MNSVKIILRHLEGSFQDRRRDHLQLDIFTVLKLDRSRLHCLVGRYRELSHGPYQRTDISLVFEHLRPQRGMPGEGQEDLKLAHGRHIRDVDREGGRANPICLDEVVNAFPSVKKEENEIIPLQIGPHGSPLPGRLPFVLGHQLYVFGGES